MLASPKYPIYVISKGRWERRLTVRALERMGVDFSVVIEPQEYEQYAAVIPRFRLIVLPFSNLGQGSIPARNFVWEHAKSTGAHRHWIIDDNITCFRRFNRNIKLRCDSAAMFRAAEDFVDRYTNVAIAGFNYFMFCNPCEVMPPFYLNTRIYSCILIDNALPHRWRGRYNEDTDLSLRVLKDGYCTVLFNAFLAEKVATMLMKGGNTDELYKDDGRRKMAESLVEQHPDIVKVTWKFNRWHHQVDYTPFRRNELKLREDVELPKGTNNYGMVVEPLVSTEDSEELANAAVL